LKWQNLPAPNFASATVAVGRACPHHARPKGFEALDARDGASRDPGFFLIVERERPSLFPKKIFVFNV